MNSQNKWKRYSNLIRYAKRFLGVLLFQKIIRIILIYRNKDIPPLIRDDNADDKMPLGSKTGLCPQKPITNAFMLWSHRVGRILWAQKHFVGELISCNMVSFLITSYKLNFWRPNIKCCVVKDIFRYVWQNYLNC